MDLERQAAARFVPEEEILGIVPFGNGNVHATFLVTLKEAEKDPVLLQRVNTRIFPRPEWVMHNIRIFSEHARKRLPFLVEKGRKRWEIPEILPDKSGADLWTGADGSCWRAFRFIGRTKAYDVVSDDRHAFEVGYALGMFHRLLEGLPAGDLFDTLEGFHIAPRYLQRFDRVESSFSGEKTAELNWALAFVRKRRALTGVLEEAKTAGRLRVVPIHGDPKVNNVLIDSDTGQAVSLVDWDTIKPGLLHYDIGDCLRSSGNPLGELTDRWSAVHFRLDLARRVWAGYLKRAEPLLGEEDCPFLYEAVRLISFELGLRFLTDYLEGNVYFKVTHPNQNLYRALVQFRLTQSIEEQEPEIRRLFQGGKR